MRLPLTCTVSARVWSHDARTTAPDDATLYATHHAVAVILDRIGTDVQYVAHTQVAAA